MGRINQLLAVVGDIRKRAKERLTEAHHKLAKNDLVSGISRTYQPKADDGDQLPDEGNHVQYTVSEAINDTRAAIVEMLDAVGSQKLANTSAFGTPNGLDASLPPLPVEYLLFLEKDVLPDLRTFINKMPTLDTAQKWSESGEANVYETESFGTTKTQKVPKTHVQVEPTKEHPAQVVTFNEDIVVGTWTTKKFSGAIHPKQRAEYMQRVDSLMASIKKAREDANNNEVTEMSIGEDIFSYVFGS